MTDITRTVSRTSRVGYHALNWFAGSVALSWLGLVIYFYTL